MLDVLSVLECLLEQLRAAHERERRVPDELLLALHAAVPALLEPALELLDRAAVSRLVAAGGRAVYRVLGSGGAPYYCPQTLTYCPCPAYQYTVLQRSVTGRRTDIRPVFRRRFVVRAFFLRNYF